MAELKKALGSRIDYILSRLDNLETHLIEDGYAVDSAAREKLGEIKAVLEEIGQ